MTPTTVNRKSIDNSIHTAVENFLKFLKLLATRKYTVEELATRMDMTTRSMYRYIRMAEQMGFVVDKSFNGKYFLDKDHLPEVITALLPKEKKSYI